jgi:4-amino-4-deoxy-L-arabinose transferase-like glycosyltransferase
MTQRNLLGPIIAIFLVLVLARLLAAALVPIVQDEAYYLEWSKALDWGYFDHPPLVAWVGITSWLAPGSAFMGRLGTMIVAALSFPFMVGLLRQAGLTQRPAFLAGLLLVNFNFCGIFFGALNTPDAAFVTAWCAALYEAAAALNGDRRRWLTAGLATGLGLLAKYPMVLIGPVFLWALLAGDRRALRTPWPYAGGFLALVIFSPHLAWNARNEWVPIRMQLQHGLQGGHDPGFAPTSDLPWPQRAEPGSAELHLGGYFRPPPPADAAPAPPENEKSALVEFVQRTSEYIGVLLIIWGAFLVPIIHRFILRLRGRLPPEPPPTAAVKPLLIAATWVPILFFGLVSLVSPVEANWPMVYTVGAAALLAGFGAARLGPMMICAGINLGLFLALVVYAHNPVFARGGDRVLHETHGWSELADYVAQLEGPIFTGREQTTSMIRFYRPDLTVVQWPGLNQPSEYVRRREWNPHALADLRRRGAFWLVIGGPSPPHLAGFKPVEIIGLHDCVDLGLVVTEVSARPFAAPCPEGTVHTWYAIRYLVERTAGSR